MTAPAALAGKRKSKGYPRGQPFFYTKTL